MKTFVQIGNGEQSPLPPEEKEELLLSRLAGIPSLIVALSGGADSAYLAWASNRALGERALSVTALSPSFSAYDREMVEQFAKQLALRHEFIETHEMENPAYRANQPDRCYFCKDELFSVLDKLAGSRGFAAIAYGVNADDTLDFRPGHRAATEHQVLAPLLDVGLAKSEIRRLSRRASLPTWDRPASACLASRLPYGSEVTRERLALGEGGEAALPGAVIAQTSRRNITDCFCVAVGGTSEELFGVSLEEEWRANRIAAAPCCSSRPLLPLRAVTRAHMSTEAFPAPTRYRALSVWSSTMPRARWISQREQPEWCRFTPRYAPPVSDLKIRNIVWTTWCRILP